MPNLVNLTVRRYRRVQAELGGQRPEIPDNRNILAVASVAMDIDEATGQPVSITVRGVRPGGRSLESRTVSVSPDAIPAVLLPVIINMQAAR